MTDINPALALQLARLQARDQVLTHAASHQLAEHAHIAAPFDCLCAICRELRAQGVEPVQGIPTVPPRHRCPLLAGGAPNPEVHHG